MEPELLRETGACLHMTVMDYDVFSNDDFAGHVFFNLNNILGLREVIAGGFANVPQETKNIFHPKPEGHYFEGKNEALFVLNSFSLLNSALRTHLCFVPGALETASIG